MIISTELVNLLQNHDNAGRNRFWNAAFEPVLAICSRVVGPGPLSVDITTDLLNDFMFRYVDNLSNPKGAWAYLKMMAIRRSVRERERIYKNEQLEEQRMTLTSSNAVDEGVLLLLPGLDDCLGTLTPKAQSSIRLKYRQDLSNEQIGRMIGGSKQYIGRLIKQSLALLRDCLQQKAMNHG